MPPSLPTVDFSAVASSGFRGGASRRWMVAVAGVVAVGLCGGAGLAFAQDAPASSPPAKRAPRVVVDPLEARGFEASLGAVLTEALCAALFETRDDLQALCPDDVRTLLAHRQAELSMGGDTRTLADTLRQLQARFTLSGSVSRVGDQTVVSLTLIDLKESAPVSRATRMAALPKGADPAPTLLEAVRLALFDLMSRLPRVPPEAG